MTTVISKDPRRAFTFIGYEGRSYGLINGDTIVICSVELAKQFHAFAEEHGVSGVRWGGPSDVRPYSDYKFDSVIGLDISIIHLYN